MSREPDVIGSAWRAAQFASWRRRPLKNASCPRQTASGRSRPNSAKGGSRLRLGLELNKSIFSTRARAAASTSLSVEESRLTSPRTTRKHRRASLRFGKDSRRSDGWRTGKGLIELRLPGDLRCWVAGLSRTRRRTRFDRDGGTTRGRPNLSEFCSSRLEVSALLARGTKLFNASELRAPLGAASHPKNLTRCRFSSKKCCLQTARI